MNSHETILNSLINNQKCILSYQLLLQAYLNQKWLCWNWFRHFIRFFNSRMPSKHPFFPLMIMVRDVLKNYKNITVEL